MKKIVLFTFLVFTTILTSNAQNNSSYVKFTEAQITSAKKIAVEKITVEVSFNKGVEYEGKNFWFVTTKDDKSYYFNSDKNFKDVIYIEEYYNSLMEYIIEESDF
ncbi:hypothetical protein [Tenacibaculum finnmarkense]|uniref:hypothetical protein n=1 Tax=Tenacibaculum finnmarkense TaxID=2781243 RepID=UPI000C3D1501|nr:hypothetical protein [Tenacibaculum finnmarkense]MCD8440618.1 hypothetical protein [Tenacibaculum finnmarkense genomovar ulcerans]MCG8721493.1 hypothetical protein [Tenacibaculum finnmarkense]SOS55328.1 conserved exported hypothetical protein [Tenacibaculum finnmarkense]